MRFADDVDPIGESKVELAELIHRLDKAASDIGMLISMEKARGQDYREKPKLDFYLS